MLVNQHHKLHLAGFTLLEMALVITLIAILATIAIPKINPHWFEQQAEFQQALTVLRYAHQVAIASGCQVRIQVSSDTISLYYNNAPTRCGGGAVINPLLGGAVRVTVNVGVYGDGWIYDEQGKPITGQQNLSIGDYNLRVEAATGFVHVN